MSSGEVPVVRSVVAVLAGFFAVMVLSAAADLALSRSPDTAASPDALWIKMAYETAFAVLAGYITARLAIKRGMLHATVMGAMVLAGRALIAALTWNDVPAWFHLGILVLIIPAALLGSKVCEIRARSIQ
jgi:hypothetical protein